jgi:transcription antitermination factor NusG
MRDNPRFDLQQSKWYVLFVRSNQEKRVAERLHARGIEHFLPCYQLMRQWKDRRVRLELPLFPGYVFVRLPFAERAKALSTPHVVNLVGTKTSPSAISDEEIAWIRLGIEHGKAVPHPYLNVGERVVITSGALSGLEGLLLKIRNSTRVVVALDSIARAFVIEVDACCVRPAGAG